MALDIGRVGYTKFCESLDWKDENGQQLLPWELKSQAFQDAWRSAAVAVLNEVSKDDVSEEF